jgi:putative ABC transport system permease protein
MRQTRNLRISLAAFAAHKVRTALGVAGAAVGVAGVLVTTAIGEGARRAIEERIGSLGGNMLVISSARVESRAGRRIQGDGWSRTLKVEDAKAILAGSSAVVRVAPAQDRGMTAKYGPIRAGATVVGTTPEWRLIRQFPLAEGRFFSREETDQSARVAVLGAAVRAALFPGSQPVIGRSIRIGRVPFQVIGTLASKGLSVDGFATEDDRIFVPLPTALNRLFNTEFLKFIYLEAASPYLMGEAEADAEAILRARHAGVAPDGGDFAIQNQRVLLNAELATRASFRRLVAGLGFLSLGVGGVGILSILLLSVRERRNEIGLRAAVGARRVDLAVQFVAEALLLSTAGGLVGIAAGYGAAAITAAVTGWRVEVSLGVIAIAVGSAVVLGLASGGYPAWRAARLDPVVALAGGVDSPGSQKGSVL